MKKDESITAAELMSRLQNDPEFLERQARRDREQARREASIKQAEAPILEELKSLDVTPPGLDSLSRHYSPISSGVVEILLRWLPLVSDETVQVLLVRALECSKGTFDGKPLVELFESSRSELLRWTIANTLAESRPLGVTDWLLSVVGDPSSGKAREMLVLAVARLAPKGPAKQALIGLLDEFPGHVAMALAKIGDEHELELLRAKEKSTKGWIKKEINKAIRSIEKRSQPTNVSDYIS